MNRKKRNLLTFGSRSFVLTAAVIVILGGIISGTVAWMYIKADPVHNTFTYGSMKIELTETDTRLDEDNKDDTNAYSLKLGTCITKDPVVTVEAGTVDSWIFIKADKTSNFDKYLMFELTEGWQALDKDEYPGVYYTKTTKSEDEQKLWVLKDNEVKVKPDVTQESLDKLAEAIEADEAEYPELSFTAYAVQAFEVDTAEEAWKIAENK